VSHHHLVIGEEAVEVLAHQQVHGAQHNGGAKGHAQADLHRAAHTPVLPGAEVLPHKGGDGHAKGADRHPEEAVQLAIGCPGRQHIRAEGVHRGLDDYVGEGVHHALQSRRQADAQNAPHEPGVDADLLQMQLVAVVAAAEGQHHQHGADGLGDNGGPGGAGHAHIEPHDQDHVQHDVGHAGHDEEKQRPAGIAHGPQGSGADVIQGGGDHTGEINADVGHRVGHDLLGGAHPLQQRGGEDHARHHQHRAENQAHGDVGVQGIAGILGVAGAIDLGEHHRGAGGHSHEEPHDQVDEAACGAAHSG